MLFKLKFSGNEDDKNLFMSKKIRKNMYIKIRQELASKRFARYNKLDLLCG